MRQKYHVVSSATLEDLVAEVNEFTTEGWELYEGLTTIEIAGLTFVAQAVVMNVNAAGEKV